jgi:hypothetical protein
MYSPTFYMWPVSTECVMDLTESTNTENGLQRVGINQAGAVNKPSYLVNMHHPSLYQHFLPATSTTLATFPLMFHPVSRTKK